MSNELSNYCSANRQPHLDDPGSFGAPGIGIADRLACFTPKRSLCDDWAAWTTGSAMDMQRSAFERCSKLAEPRCAEPTPVWELVASVPAPHCDHGQHEDAALP